MKQQTGNKKSYQILAKKIYQQIREIPIIAISVWFVTAAVIEGSRVPTGS